MPQIPLIIPLIVAGAFLGTIWSRKDPGKAWKKAFLAASLAGLLNAAYTWLVAFLKISSANLAGNAGLVFTATSGLLGLFVVLVVFLSAAGVVRYRGGKELESEE